MVDDDKNVSVEERYGFPTLLTNIRERREGNIQTGITPLPRHKTILVNDEKYVSAIFRRKLYRFLVENNIGQ